MAHIDAERLSCHEAEPHYGDAVSHLEPQDNSIDLFPSLRHGPYSLVSGRHSQLLDMPSLLSMRGSEQRLSVVSTSSLVSFLGRMGTVSAEASVIGNDTARSKQISRSKSDSGVSRRRSRPISLIQTSPSYAATSTVNTTMNTPPTPGSSRSPYPSTDSSALSPTPSNDWTLPQHGSEPNPEGHSYHYRSRARSQGYEYAKSGFPPLGYIALDDPISKLPVVNYSRRWSESILTNSTFSPNPVAEVTSFSSSPTRHLSTPIETSPRPLSQTSSISICPESAEAISTSAFSHRTSISIIRPIPNTRSADSMASAYSQDSFMPYMQGIHTVMLEAQHAQGARIQEATAATRDSPPYSGSTTSSTAPSKVEGERDEGGLGRQDEEGWPPKGWDIYVSAISRRPFRKQSQTQDTVMAYIAEKQKEPLLHTPATNNANPRPDFGDYVFDQNTSTFIPCSSSPSSKTTAPPALLQVGGHYYRLVEPSETPSHPPHRPSTITRQCTLPSTAASPKTTGRKLVKRQTRAKSRTRDEQAQLSSLFPDPSIPFPVLALPDNPSSPNVTTSKPKSREWRWSTRRRSKSMSGPSPNASFPSISPLDSVISFLESPPQSSSSPFPSSIESSTYPPSRLSVDETPRADIASLDPPMVLCEPLDRGTAVPYPRASIEVQGVTPGRPRLQRHESREGSSGSGSRSSANSALMTPRDTPWLDEPRGSWGASSGSGRGFLGAGSEAVKWYDEGGYWNNDEFDTPSAVEPRFGFGHLYCLSPDSKSLIPRQSFVHSELTTSRSPSVLTSMDWRVSAAESCGMFLVGEAATSPAPIGIELNHGHVGVDVMVRENDAHKTKSNVGHETNDPSRRGDNGVDGRTSTTLDHRPSIKLKKKPPLLFGVANPTGHASGSLG